MSELSVTSEIYAENGYETSPADIDNYVITTFPFFYNDTGLAVVDEDGDYCVQRKTDVKQYLKLEYCQSTTLKLVGLQIWRGAFLLADFILHHGTELLSNRTTKSDKTSAAVLELGSGSGLTGIVAGMKFDNVICTDIDIGGILELINRNIQRNLNNIKGRVCTMELDFKKELSEPMIKELAKVELVIAADVIYDNDLTEEFVKTLECIFAIPPKKTAYITLEKRYVFTLADLDTVAPCYEYFMECLDKAKYRSITTKQNWQITKLETNFPKYFEYDRCKELVLLKISLHDNAH
ncbi:methyltransferase-like protein 22 [Ctenocephalides felis]|uniref:methyltransferase-like protein 22 n=1 Tax=Ctenocephalides felis TaxID=7515 RepID=UPI000E6E3E7C|nr:methyltransferase-like protein 22 [Ctenocephalides felis]